MWDRSSYNKGPLSVMGREAADGLCKNCDGRNGSGSLRMRDLVLNLSPVTVTVPVGRDPCQGWRVRLCKEGQG